MPKTFKVSLTAEESREMTPMGDENLPSRRHAGEGKGNSCSSAVRKAENGNGFLWIGESPVLLSGWV